MHFDRAEDCFSSAAPILARPGDSNLTREPADELLPEGHSHFDSSPK
jgi:hypothetical protein